MKACMRKTLEKVLPVCLAIFLLAVTVSCGYAVVQSTLIFTSSQARSTQWHGEALETVADAASQLSKAENDASQLPETEDDATQLSETEDEEAQNDNRQEIQTLIGYINDLQKLQKESSSNEVMTFLFTMLSSVLVGVCAAFAAKSFATVEKANISVGKAEMSVGKAEISLSKAELSAEKAENSAKATKTSASEAATSAETAKNSSAAALTSLANAKKSYENAEARHTDAEERYADAIGKLGNLEASISIFHILISIMDARMYLDVNAPVNVNDKLKDIQNAVRHIDSSYGYDMISTLMTELSAFIGCIAMLKDSEKLNPESAAYYERILKEAIEKCEQLLTDLESAD